LDGLQNNLKNGSGGAVRVGCILKIMIRILQVVNKMDRAGLETMLMNYYRHMDRDQVQFDFLTHRPDAGDYDEEIQMMGGKVYHAPRLYPQNYGKYFAYMKDFFERHPEYRIVHSHIDAMSAFPLFAAKKAHVPVRIAHSHSSSLNKDIKVFIKIAAKKMLPSVATDFFACGKEAARFLFGNRIFNSNTYTIMNNAIQAADFSYHQAIREQERRNLGISDRFVVGHVGRFSYPKNHSFLIDIFDQIRKICPDSVLVLVGNGEDETKIRNKVDKLHLDSSVKFLGARSDVPELLQAFDTFVLPSYYEGLPVVGVEAQAADLPCFFSDTISKEVQILDNCQFISLNSSPREWAEVILSSKSITRCGRVKEFMDAGFNIDQQSEKLQKFYLNRWQEITH
jgi:Glycosyltransferase